MKRGFSGESPSARRSEFTAVFKLRSKFTCRSGQRYSASCAARNKFAGLSEQQMEDLKRFLLQFHSQAAPAELAILRVQVERPRTEAGLLRSLKSVPFTKSLGINTLPPDNDLMRC